MIGIKRNGGITPIILSDKNTLFPPIPPGPVVDPVLENNSWETIKSVCESGEAGNYWAVGDYKTTQVDSVDVRAVIVDLTVGRYKDSDNNDNNMVLELRWYNASISSDDKWLQFYGTRTMNSAGTNAGGWNGSELRTWLNGTFKGLLANDIQAAMTKTWKIPAMNGGNQEGVSLVYSDDYLTLASEKEIFGSVSYESSTEAAVETQFQQYASNNTSAFRIKYNSSGSAYSWWERSAYRNSGDSFCRVSNLGNSSSNYALNSSGVVPFIPM